MIKEISEFINSLDPALKSLGLKAKEGLHILLKIKENAISLEQWGFTRKKDQTPSDQAFLKKCATLSKLSWCVNTNKCFDLPIKAIHSCSPYCIAIKRENLINGEKYKNNTKAQVYARVDSYFEKAANLVDLETDKLRIKLFSEAISSEEQFNHWLSLILDFTLVKDTEYVIFYLDEPIEKYEESNTKYLTDKLFNTNDYNTKIGSDIYGTSDFFNGYPTKKPFLTHQSAYFSIASRISSQEARSLYDFQDIIGRNILPKPLPIFIHEEEIKSTNKSFKDASIALFKKGAEQKDQIGYKEIIESLLNDYKDQLGNYYLLYYDRATIKDFDFVSKFEYELETESGKPWKIQDWFNISYSPSINNVFQLQQTVLLPVFNNALITKTKSDNFQYKYFDDIDSKYCKSNVTFLLVQQYRKAFYDFIYKSKREAVTQEMFNHILQTSILEDIRLDEMKNKFHTQNRYIREKMNIWFSLSENFNPSKTKNSISMASKLQQHREFIKSLTKEESHIETDEQYAFAVGQVIYYLLSKSKSSDRSYKRLEPFMQQVHANELNKSIYRLFDLYKHETFSKNFNNPFAEVMDFETKTNVRNLMPIILAGIFSKNELFSAKEEIETDIIETETEE